MQSRDALNYLAETSVLPNGYCRWFKAEGNTVNRFDALRPNSVAIRQSPASFRPAEASATLGSSTVVRPQRKAFIRYDLGGRKALMVAPHI